MTTDVAERTETQATSEAESVAASEDREVTAGNTEVQPNPDQDTTPTEGGTNQPDPRQARLEALAAAEREEAEQAGYQKAVAELTGQTPEKQRELQRQKTRQAHTNTLAVIDRVYELAKDEYGTPRPLTTTELGQIKAAQNEYHKVALEAGESLAADTVQQQAYAAMPTKEAADALTAALGTEDIDLATYLTRWLEVAAPYAKSVKQMDLATATKASPKLKREIEAIKLASYDEGREQGRLDPPGTSPDGGRTGSRTAPAAKDYNELEAKYADGTATKAETVEYLRLRDQRAKTR